MLEDILDDDADMADMYLARRAQMTASAAAANATQQRDEPDRSASTTGRPGANLCSNCSNIYCRLLHAASACRVSFHVLCMLMLLNTGSYTAKLCSLPAVQWQLTNNTKHVCHIADLTTDLQEVNG